MTVSPELISAYRAAVYEVDAGDAVVAFRVEERCPALDGLLRKHAAGSAALITAHNPRSHKRSDADNAQAHRSLLSAVKELTPNHLPSWGRDPEGKWPPEAGLLIFDLPRADAFALAQRFGQYAFLWIENARPPQLLMTGNF